MAALHMVEATLVVTMEVEALALTTSAAAMGTEEATAMDMVAETLEVDLAEVVAATDTDGDISIATLRLTLNTCVVQMNKSNIDVLCPVKEA